LNLDIKLLLGLAFELKIVILIDLTSQSRDRWLLSYDIGINTQSKPSTVTRQEID